SQVADEVATKMIFPTTLPQDPEDLMIEQAVAREALRLAYEQHKQVAEGPPRGVGALERITMSAEQVMKAEMGLEQKPWHKIDLLVGSGGVISHAPKRSQAAMMMLDAFAPEGVVELVVDSVFMLPHLGVLSTILPDVALQVLVKDCLVRLGTAVCLTGAPAAGAGAVTVSGKSSEGRLVNTSVGWGEIRRVPLGPGERFEGRVTPSAHADAGKGPGRPYDLSAAGGEVGLIIDARGRPVDFTRLGARALGGGLEC
ncbi:MAG: glutamate mutase L, partial [Bacillota bacterium]|nr:glutamate mutase L [Bacillota bacterium]